MSDLNTAHKLNCKEIKSQQIQDLSPWMQAVLCTPRSRRYVHLLSLSSGAGVALGRAEEGRRRRRGVGRRLPPARTELVAEQRQLGRKKLLLQKFRRHQSFAKLVTRWRSHQNNCFCIDRDLNLLYHGPRLQSKTSFLLHSTGLA